MSLIMYDGFDNYSIASYIMTEQGPWDDGYSNIYGNGSQKPFSEGKSLDLSSGKDIAINIPDQSGKTIYIGFMFYFYNITNNRTSKLFSINEDAVSGGPPTIEQLSVEVDGGFIKVYRGDYVTLLGTGTIEIPVETWFYLEFKFLVHGSTGVVETRVGGKVDISLTSQNTQAAASDSVLSFDFDATMTSGSMNLDDLWICNSDGSAPHNTYLGRVRVQQLLPTGDNSVVWSHNTGTTNYETIDELTSVDDDTSYIHTTTPLDKDLYDLEDMNTDVTTVLALKTKAIARKTDANAKSYKLGIKHSTNEQLSSARTLTESYTYEEDYYTTSDGSTTAWTETTVNAALLVIEDQ